MTLEEHELELQGAREHMHNDLLQSRIFVMGEAFVVVKQAHLLTVLSHLDALDGVDPEDEGEEPQAIGYVDQD